MLVFVGDLRGVERRKGLMIKNIPHSPGCYLYKDAKGTVIYVGKAKDLKKRVGSYFQKNDFDAKTKALVAKIAALDFMVTDTETEALILENTLIKKHQPKYNINLKDAKRYAYLQLTEEVFPRLITARDKATKGQYFGPFVNAEARKEISEFLNKVFKLRTCRTLPKKVCLRYHLGHCSAPCEEKILPQVYQERVAHVELILKGKIGKIVKLLTQEMKAAAEKQNFEYALELKKQREALNWLGQKQKMERAKSYDEDVLNFMVKAGQVYLMVFKVYKGILEHKQSFVFEEKSDFLAEFILQFYTQEKVPKELILPIEIDPALIELLKIRVIVPQKGEKKQLLALVAKNIEAYFFAGETKLLDLQAKLGLKELPRIMECFDISHLAGTHMVASMVRFSDAVPDKANYRKFKIKTVEGIDDCAAIAEVVRRRYTRLLTQEAELPDLIIIDGGKGQLGFALAELQKLGVDVPVIAIAKQFEEVFRPGSSRGLRLNKKSEALKLLQAIRDEAHRFAVGYNRGLRSKNVV
jgi:excinuclease ABC subunit C